VANCIGDLAATREAMSEARLPIQYRDSCANLLIPLNRCRYETYYLPWKCEVCRNQAPGLCEIIGERQGDSAERVLLGM
jgi:hypothetical protein